MSPELTRACCMQAGRCFQEALFLDVLARVAITWSKVRRNGQNESWGQRPSKRLQR